MKRTLTFISTLLASFAALHAADKPKPEYPMPPLVKPSGPISIDVGRQLFVDDWLIAETTLTRTFHQAKVLDAPVLKAETELETQRGTAEGAVLFDGGVWFDPQDRLFKMWYAAGFRDGIAYATSKDGLHWERPQLDVSPGENRVLPYQKGWELSGFSVALDQFANDPAQRFKMLAYHRYHNRFPGDKGEENPPAKMYVSADGVHWGEPQFVKCFTGDNVSMFYDPFRTQWVFSTRNRAPSVLRPGAMGSNGKPVTVRARFRFDGPDFIETGLTANGAKLWLKPDERDKADPEFNIDPELYKFGAVAYESIMLGAVGMFYGPQNDVAKELKRPKTIDIQLAYSRDGVNFPRPSRDAFIACARKPGTWNRGYLHSANGVCCIVGDELWFYFGTWSGQSQRENAEYVMAGGSVGLAKLRRDGFASMDADAKGGALTTAPVTFSGKFPFVNLAAKDGELRAEILDADGKVIAPFSKENCTPIKADATKQRLAWKGADDFSALIGKPVHFRFHLTNAQLYAFWVSKSPDGASGGYVAAGGPGFSGPIDAPAHP
ncbi:MAG: hypothetical protein WCF18_02545 [Chthoniobacteraceae bacterium]